MGRVIAAINMTLDGFCDHTAGIADDDLHRHYSKLIKSSDVLLYGRITYQLMQYWQNLARNPTNNKAIDDFARIMDKAPKIVFSRTIHDTGWKTARLANATIEQEITAARQQWKKDILIGSPGLIIQAINLNLVDECQFCVHPVVSGKGLPLFKNIDGRRLFTLIKTKVFSSGSIVLYYQPKD